MRVCIILTICALSLFQHSCVKARVNGRDGVIVAGGASDADPNLNMVEFFDLRSHKWMSLGRTRQGRRFPGKSGTQTYIIQMAFLNLLLSIVFITCQQPILHSFRQINMEINDLCENMLY